MKITQCEMIIDYLDEYGSITPLEAMRDLGIYRLASRIADLKKQGYKIKSKMVSVEARNGGRTYVASYSWEDDKADTPTETDFTYFTAEQVRNMSNKEVRENYNDILKSMKKWY